MLRKGDVVALACLSLLAMGVVMVRSAGLRVGEGAVATAGDVLRTKETALALLAMGAMFAASRLPLQQLLERLRGRGAVAIALALAGLCLLPYVPHIGRSANGAHRWIAIAGLSVQPSELAKWASPLLLAWWAGRRGVEGMASFRCGLLPAAGVLGGLCAVIAVEDLGTAALIAGAGALCLVAGGARLRHFVALVPFAAAGCVVAVLAAPYRVRRLVAFLDPFADPQGAGYHMIQSLTAIASGGPAGRGLGFGLQKFGYLPEDTTDFLFAIIAEELGAAGVVAVLSLYIAVLWAGALIVASEPSRRLRVAGAGILATFAGQAAINLAAVTGLGPTKGIALPLLSAGGTGWVLTAAALGLLVGMDRVQARRPHSATTTAGPTPAIA